jgi:hypothetical protein
MLPPDAQAYGFDTNADALGVEPALLDRYLTAAAKIARLAVATRRSARVRALHRVKGNSNEQTWLWQTRASRRIVLLGSRGGIAARHYFPVDGEYVFKVRLLRTYAGVITGLTRAGTIECASMARASASSRSAAVPGAEDDADRRAAGSRCV